MVEEQDRKLTFPNKNIKNTSTSGMINTEHLLKASRRPSDFKGQENLRNWLGQKEKRNRRSLHPGRSCGGKFPTPWAVLTGTEISLDGGELQRLGVEHSVCGGAKQ